VVASLGLEATSLQPHTMIRQTLFALCAAAATAMPVYEDLGGLAKAVNAANAGWTAHDDGRYAGRSSAETAKYCGTRLTTDSDYVESGIPVYTSSVSEAALPVKWDWRNSPKCAKVIGTVRDQSACGSCWAMSASETFTDRRCIAVNDTKLYSSMDTAGCCSGAACGMSQGCNGGQQGAALGWMAKVGVVTGGNEPDMQVGDSCKAYWMKPCAHHVAASPKYPACPTAEYKTVCEKQCSDKKYTKKYAADKVVWGSSYQTTGVPAIMEDIMKHGPTAVAFTVYADFETYKSGVYKHVSGSALGGHAVEMVGWGVDPKAGAYWWVKNSWNDQWGDKGYFKIAKGSNECGIEDSVFGTKVAA